MSSFYSSAGDSTEQDDAPPGMTGDQHYSASVGNQYSSYYPQNASATHHYQPSPMMQHPHYAGNPSYNQQMYQKIHSHHPLPSYNNNYEEKFQSFHQNSVQKSHFVVPNSEYCQPLDVSVFEVRFKCTKGDYLLADTFRVEPGEFVRVEADRGYDIGIIYMKKYVTAGMEIPRKRIIGHVTDDEMAILPSKMAEEAQAVLVCRQMAAQRGLLITIADVEFQFDRNKLTVIFASEGRVDFRELVRDMFSFFRVRIWMQKVSPSEAVALMELAANDCPSAMSDHLNIAPVNHRGNLGLHSGSSSRRVKYIEHSVSTASGYTTSGDSPPLAASTRKSPPPVPVNLSGSGAASFGSGPYSAPSTLSPHDQSHSIPESPAAASEGHLSGSYASLLAGSSSSSSILQQSFSRLEVSSDNNRGTDSPGTRSNPSDCSNDYVSGSGSMTPPKQIDPMSHQQYFSFQQNQQNDLPPKSQMLSNTEVKPGSEFGIPPRYD